MSEHVEVVINIPKYYLTHPQDYSCLAECVRRGTILPKGHGKLKDADELLENAYRIYDGVRHMWSPDFVVNADDINSAPTILEATKYIHTAPTILEAEGEA